VSVTLSWLWSIRGVQSLLFDTRVREIKNEISIRQIFSRTRRFCHMSRSLSGSLLVRLSVFSLIWQDTLFLGLIYFFDQMLVCSFWGGGSWLDFFFLVFVDMNRHHATQFRGRSRSRYRDPWMGYNLRSKLIALDFRKRTREKMESLGGNNIWFRKSLSQTFSLIRLDSSQSPRFPFFLLFCRHTAVTVN